MYIMDILLYVSCWSVHTRHYQNHTIPLPLPSTKLRGYSLEGESCRFTVFFCKHMKDILFRETLLDNGVFCNLEPFWVHLDLNLSVAHMPNAPTIKFKWLLSRLFIVAILSLVTTSVSSSDSVLMRQLLRKQLDRAQAPHWMRWQGAPTCCWPR